MQIHPISNHSTLPDIPSSAIADHTGFLDLGGTRAMTDALNMGGKNITNVGTFSSTGAITWLGTSIADWSDASKQIVLKPDSFPALVFRDTNSYLHQIVRRIARPGSANNFRSETRFRFASRIRVLPGPAIADQTSFQSTLPTGT